MYSRVKTVLLGRRRRQASGSTKQFHQPAWSSQMVQNHVCVNVDFLYLLVSMVGRAKLFAGARDGRGLKDKD